MRRGAMGRGGGGDRGGDRGGVRELEEAAIPKPQGSTGCG